MPTITALKEVVYAGRTYYPGDTFDASEKDAKILCLLRKTSSGAPARRVVDLPPRVAKAVEPEVAEEPAPLSGSYLRRDMQAVGQTGEDKPVQSSRRGRPRKVQVLPDSEDDAG